MDGNFDHHCRCDTTDFSHYIGCVFHREHIPENSSGCKFCNRPIPEGICCSDCYQKTNKTEMDVGSKCKYCLRSIPGGTMCYTCYCKDDPLLNKECSSCTSIITEGFFCKECIDKHKVFNAMPLDQLRVVEIGMIANVRKAEQKLADIQYLMHQKIYEQGNKTLIKNN
jgi:hypothetical protein